MKLKEFDILLDLKRNKQIENIEIVQNDFDSNILNITLVEDFQDYILSGLDIEIAFAKSDGKTVLQDKNNGVEIMGNKIVCKLKTNTIASPGKVLAEVRIIQEEKLLTSARFNFFVRKAIVNDETIASTDEFPILDKKIKEVNDLIEEVQGMEAIKGDKGDKGDKGEKGDKGDVGPIGPQGVQGPQGDIGPQGETGLKGDKGEQGEQGIQGIQGERGEQGIQGQTGPQGEKGDQGIQGETGDKGEKGDAGTSLKILGSYDTLEELETSHPDGSSLDGGFMIDTDYYYWGLNGWESAGPLQGPQGEQGPRGEQGPKGEQGGQGDRGPQGLEGEKGEDGYTPIKGIDYFDGEQGPRGPQGEKGDTGPTGSDAEVTDTNIKNALGYTPANQDDIPTKTSDLVNDSDFITANEVPMPTKDDIGLGNVDNVKQMPISDGTLENYRERLVSLTGSTPNIDLSLANVFKLTLESATTLSISNPSEDVSQSLTLIAIQTNAPYTITFPANVKWMNGEIPDLSEGDKVYYLLFDTIDGGGTWHGRFGGMF